MPKTTTQVARMHKVSVPLGHSFTFKQLRAALDAIEKELPARGPVYGDFEGADLTATWFDKETRRG